MLHSCSVVFWGKRTHREIHLLAQTALIVSSSNRVFSKATGRKAGGGSSSDRPTARPVTSNQTFVLHFLSPHCIYSFDQRPEFKPVVQLQQRHVKEPFMRAQYSKSNNSSHGHGKRGAHMHRNRHVSRISMSLSHPRALSEEIYVPIHQGWISYAAGRQSGLCRCFWCRELRR